ncbi:hypothetical protein ACRQ4B_04815 [Curtobacterium sp. SP.BCo]|uniref:hypothetical protein n=1 Tax=Curtobacterium sp. SP.BCo TaxID=3435229 RepID=UPI003F739845
MIAAALGVLLVAASVLVPAASASAMTQIGAVPRGVPGSSVQAVVQNQSSGTGAWIIDAPPSTTITQAQSIPGPGLLPFTCVPIDGGTQADCQFSGLWGANNQVAITLTIDPAAEAPQRVTGTSTIQNVESGTYAVDIAPLGAPTITSPADGAESIVAPTSVQGTKVAGTGVVVRLDGTQVLDVPLDQATTWSASLASPPDVGTHTVRVDETDQYGNTATATSTFTVLAPAALSVTQSGPTELLPTRPVTRTIVVENPGPGASRATTLAVDTGGLPTSACTVDDAAVECATLGGGIALGALDPGASVRVTVTGAAPSGTAPGTTYAVTATATSSTDPDSPVSTTSTLEVVPLGALAFRTPVAGSSTTDRRPGISGVGAVSGATVTVTTDDGAVGVCVATADARGRWACEPGAFRSGSVVLAATQAFGGLRSEPTTVAFRITKPAPPLAPLPPTQPTGPGGAAGVPGTGSGSAGGPVGSAGGTGGSTGAGAGSPGGGSSGGAAGGSGASPSTGGSGGSGGAGTNPTPGNGTGNGSGTDGAGDDQTNDGAMPMEFRFGTQRIMPGTAADMRGTLGPNASGATVAVTFQARMSTGMVYRNVDVQVDDQPLGCSVATTSFSCMIPLDPGQQADVDVRVYADPVNAPDTAVQQISLASNRASQANAVTVTTAVAKGETEASQLAAQITTFNATEFPGAMVPLLAMLLFALAATVAGRRAAGGPAAPATASPSGTGPPEASRASSPDRADRADDPNQPTSDPPSGSNR